MLKIENAADIKRDKGTYLIYSPPGMGKTSSARYFPGNTLILDIDRTTNVLHGNKNIDIIKIDNINTWDDWQSVLINIEKIEKPWASIMVDNISELERCLLSDLGRKGKNMGVPSQGNYQQMQFRMVNSLRHLKTFGMNVIMTAWETTDLYTTAEGQQFNRSYPQLNGKILNNIAGLCDVVGKLMINSEGERGFTLMPTNSIFAKNQIDDRKGCLQSELILTDEKDEVKTVPE